MRILFGYLEQFRIFVCSEEIPSGFPRYGSGLHTSSTALRDCPRTWVSRKRETCVKPRAVIGHFKKTTQRHKKKLLKFILQILTLLILTLTIQSCATFPKSSLSQRLWTQNDLTRINGQYKVRAEKDSLLDNTYIDYHSAFEKFYRGKGRGSKDTMKIDNLDNYSFELKLVENQKVEITYLKDKISFRKFTLEYQLKNDGFIY